MASHALSLGASHDSHALLQDVSQAFHASSPGAFRVSDVLEQGVIHAFHALLD